MEWRVAPTILHGHLLNGKFQRHEIKIITIRDRTYRNSWAKLPAGRPHSGAGCRIRKGFPNRAPSLAFPVYIMEANADMLFREACTRVMHGASRRFCETNNQPCTFPFRGRSAHVNFTIENSISIHGSLLFCAMDGLAGVSPGKFREKGANSDHGGRYPLVQGRDHL